MNGMAWGGDNDVLDAPALGSVLRKGFFAPSSVMEQSPSYHTID
jgi:hypothetical protein